MNSGSALKVIRSSWLSWIVPSISPSVRRMIHRIFSPSLDPQRMWFALNDEFCVAPPRKFCSNFIFDMFPEEVCRVNIVDLQDENGGPVPLSWFNKGSQSCRNPVCWYYFRCTRWKSTPKKTLPKENFLNLSSSNI